MLREFWKSQKKLEKPFIGPPFIKSWGNSKKSQKKKKPFIGPGQQRGKEYSEEDRWAYIAYHTHLKIMITTMMMMMMICRTTYKKQTESLLWSRGQEQICRSVLLLCNTEIKNIFLRIRIPISYPWLFSDVSPQNDNQCAEKLKVDDRP